MGIASWAGLWFGLTLPAIVMMYLFKRQYLDTTVPSHLLWERILRNMEANRPWQKLQNRLLLWLQLLAAALLVAALMLPFVWVQGGHQGHTVIIADTSASMSTALGTPPRDKRQPESRLDRMKEQLADYIDAMNPEEEITLLQLGSQPRVLLSRESDRAVLKKTVTELSPDYGIAAYRETLSLASALTRNDPDSSVAIYTDGQWNGNSGAGNIRFEVPVQMVSSGEDGEGNAAIEQFGVKHDGSEAAGTGIATVRNYRTTNMETTLDVYGDGNLLASKPVSAGAGQSATVSFDELPAADVYRLVLGQNDAYPADNEAFAFRETADAPNVLLLSSGNLFLEKAMQLTGAHITRMEPPAASGQDKDSGPALPGVQPDIIVIDGQEPDFIHRGPWSDLLRKTPLWTLGGQGEKVQPESGETETLQHPVTRYLTLPSAPAAQLREAEVPLWAEPILNMGGRPAAYAGMDRGVARLVFLFALEDGDLPLRPEFPILVGNAMEWLQSGRAAGLGRVIAGGEIDIPVAAGTAEAVWVPVDGYAIQIGAENIPVERKEQGILSRQQSPGIPGLWRFNVQGADGSEQPGYLVEVMADPAESAVSNLQSLPISGSDSHQLKGGSDPLPESRYSLVYLAALLALIVILAEWGVYQRGRSI